MGAGEHPKGPTELLKEEELVRGRLGLPASATDLSELKLDSVSNGSGTPRSLTLTREHFLDRFHKPLGGVKPPIRILESEGLLTPRSR